ncbi:hypothetical protein E4U32_000388 [Claviceps aff. humidiphila group G2b]|nr:hypothetical protein E4U32_000388 [Claviceps aff. humidiphila group G2b]
MPNRRGSLNLRPASARRLPKRYESEEHHQDDSRQGVLVYASHRSSARKQASALQTTKKRRAAAAAAATNVGALSALAITTSPLRKEGAQQHCRVHHHRVVQGTASWSLSAPFLGAEADMSTTTPLFSLGDLDWGSDDDDVSVVQEAALDQAGHPPIHGMSSSTTWRSTTATNRVS